MAGSSVLVDAALDAEGQILGHEAGLHGLNAHLLEGIAELGELVVVVELGPPGKTARPGEDRGDGVGRGLATLLVDAVVTGHGAVSGLSLDGLTVGGHQDGGHQTERAEA